ncbi:MAG TPA: hypothetical protein VK766_02050 [Cytophagaceae bacterium]|jgi:hypothetical protein|nr:hypothetical protein [Cytophagaceae bacterium]
MGIFIHTKIKLIEKGTGIPMTGESISVKLYDKDLLSDDFLGEASPDKEGSVEIKFDLDKIKSADSPLEEFPDLYFKVYKNNHQYFESYVTDNIDTAKEGDFNFSEGKIIDLGTYLI